MIKYASWMYFDVLFSAVNGWEETDEYYLNLIFPPVTNRKL